MQDQHNGISSAKVGQTFADAQAAMAALGVAYRRLIRKPAFQAMIRADYEARLAELPWWRFRERRDLTQRYRMLTSDATPAEREGRSPRSTRLDL